MNAVRSVLFWVACSTLALGAARASAQPMRAGPPAPVRSAQIARDPERPPRDESDTDPKWYGWQTLTADAISLALIPAGVGVFGFLLATPIVHGAHDRVGIAGASFGLRVVGTVVPAALWLAGCFELNWDLGDGSGGGDDSIHDDAMCDAILPAWALIGLVGSITLDAAVFAYEPRRPRATRNFASLQLTPWAAHTGSGGLAVRGRF